jgi:hypothetical protein
VKIWSDPIPALSRLHDLLEQSRLAWWTRWRCFCDDPFIFLLGWDAHCTLDESNLTDPEHWLALASGYWVKGSAVFGSSEPLLCPSES